MDLQMGSTILYSNEKSILFFPDLMHLTLQILITKLVKEPAPYKRIQLGKNIVQ